MTQPNFRDVELISTYLDGQLPQADAARLEIRLKNDPQLRMIFDEMGQARALLRKLPARRAPRNFTLSPKMAGIKPPLPRVFPVFRFASLLAAVLFFFGYAANVSVPAISALRAAAPAPVLGMGGGGGGDNNPSAMEASPAATQAPELPASPASGAFAEPTATAELRALAPPAANDSLAATEMANAPGAAQSKINPGSQDSFKTPAEQIPVELPVSPLLLFGLLGFAIVSGATAYFVSLNSERTWFKARSLQPGKMNTRQLVWIVLGLLALAVLVSSIYWLSTTTFYAPVPAAGIFPGGSGDKGPASGGDKGGPAVSDAQGFTLSPGLGYNFSAADSAGLVTAIDFPADVFKSEMLVSYIPGLSTATDGIAYPAFNSFSLVPADKTAEPLLPFTISLDYSPNAVSGLDENKLALYWWSGSDWQDAATTCSPVSAVEHLTDVHRLRVEVCRMGSFVLVAP